MLPSDSVLPRPVVVLGSFVADLSFRMSRLPVWGETLMGSGFAMGPGGKGSNQAVAAARAGARVQIVTKIGADGFGELARRTWDEAGVDASLVSLAEAPTGAAAILIDDDRGENAIVVVPGACSQLTPEEVERVAGVAIGAASVLLTQCELPLTVVERGLVLARAAGVPTVLNPAPAPPGALSPSLLALVDFLIPNETEAAMLSGLPVDTPEQAATAAARLQERGAQHVIVTLGPRGALVCTRGVQPVLVPAYVAGPCAETTGAGDAFCGAFVAALAEGREVLTAARFGCATAGLSVTRPGTAASMPHRAEIEALLADGS